MTMTTVITILLVTGLSPHNLCAKVKVTEQNLRIEAWFDNDTPADGAKVKLLLNKKVMQEAVTDERGICTMPTPALGSYVIEVYAGGGHRAEVPFTIESMIDEQTAGADEASVRQRRWWGAIAGLGIIAGLTFVGRGWYLRRTN